VQIANAWPFIALIALGTSSVLAQENGPAGWLACRPEADPHCTASKAIVLPQVREKPELTSAPTCSEGTPSTSRLLDELLARSANAAAARIATELPKGCQAVTDEGSGGKVAGVTCAGAPKRSSCASVCVIAARPPDFDYAYVRVCMQGHLLQSVTMKGLVPKLSPGPLQNWCMWDAKTSSAVPYASVSQFRTKLSEDGTRFAACAIGSNWSDSEPRSFSMQTLLTQQPLPAPQGAGETLAYHALAAAPLAAATIAQHPSPAPPPAPAVAAQQAAPAAAAQQAAPSDAQLIASAMAAAPRQLAQAATIVAMSDTGEMRTLRAGTNGFTCMPDDPSTPGPDPMCADANAMEWLQAYLTHTAPPAGKIGFIYMLAGGSDASNTDPYARRPAANHHWIKTGPHVMIVGADARFYDQYPKTADPDTSAPYVMWAGTPYEHLMAPAR